MVRPTKQELIDFEKEIAAIYESGAIRAPIHLRDGCEEQLIDIFKNIDPMDFVFSTWASHLHALLHGVPRELVKEHILAGRSITLCFPEFRFFTSAIVGDIAAPSVGVALALKRRGSKQRVWCFLGDMAVMTGAANEAIRYSRNWDLPVTFVVEDNQRSVGTPTADVWNQSAESYVAELRSPNVLYYNYELSYPHSGTGVFVSF